MLILYFNISEAHLRVEKLTKEYGGDCHHVSRVIARSIAQAFDGKPEQALKLLDKLRCQMETAVQSRLRSSNAIAYVIIVALFLALISLVSVFDDVNWLPFNAVVIDRYSTLATISRLTLIPSAASSFKIRSVVMSCFSPSFSSLFRI